MITLSDTDICEKFAEVYSKKRDDWRYASYRLGFKSVLVKGYVISEIPKEPELLIAFHNGRVDGLQTAQERKDLEKRLATSKPSEIKQPSTKKYVSPF